MTYQIEQLEGICRLLVSFADEGIDLEAITHVKGDKASALRYLSTFEADLRRNYADRFPLPEIPEGEGMEI